MDIKSAPREIFYLFSVEHPIWHEYYLSLVTHDFCIVQVNFFDDSFNSLDSYCLTNFECFTHDDRETSEKIGDNIFTCEGKYHSSDTCSSKESACIYTDFFENNKSSNNPYTKKYRKPNGREELSHHQVFHRKIVLDLVKNEARNICDYQYNK